MARGKTLSAKDKYERQKALARERQRRRREKLTEEQLEAKRKYDRERHQKLKNENKIKTVKDMSERELRKKRKYWREQNRKREDKKKALAAALINTPPSSPSVTESGQKKRGRKMIRRDRSKIYRKAKQQSAIIEKLERRIEKYKKRLTREKNKIKITCSPSPRKEVAAVIGKDIVSPRIRKQLFLGFVLQKQIASKVKQISGTKKKSQQLRKVVGNEVLKKYRAQNYYKKLVPYKSNKMLSQCSDTFQYLRKTKMSIRQELSKILLRFFEDDSVSRICPGKKDFIRQGKLRKQRRILQDTLYNLHKRFQDEVKCKISLSSFSRSRPFWVTFPKKSDRETCACIKHSNMDLLVTALKKYNVIKEKNVNEVVGAVVCSPKYENCMMGQCEVCTKKDINFSYEEDFKIKYFKWKIVKEVKIIKSRKKTVTKTIKSKEIKQVSKMIEEFRKELTEFKKHVYFAVHQISQLKYKVKDLKKNELVFRLDFSENYVAKYSEEVQSVHFGASKQQLSLNTGVRYANVSGKVKSLCFCTVSDNLDHQAHAVWAHMAPILKRSAFQFPDTVSIHFFSDSPSNQYRNRINMHLFKSMVPKYFPKVQQMTWNFTEAGHGKGPMDGVGGTLKRGADRKVAYGADIKNSSDFVKAMKDSTILLLEINSKEIEKMKNKVELKSISNIPGIMKVHQVTYSKGVMYARWLSCFDCPPSQYCDHYTLWEVFPDDIDEEDLDDEIIYINSKKKIVMKVDDVYSSSEDESLQEPLHLINKCDDVKTSCEPPNTFDDADQVIRPGTSREFDIEKKEEALKLHLNPKERSTIPITKTMEAEIDVGVFVIVKYQNKSKNSKYYQFVGVCQSKVINNEVEVMFLKNCTKDNDLYFVDEKDVSLVHFNQIVSVLPMPALTLKGNRVFYKFKMPTI